MATPTGRKYGEIKKRLSRERSMGRFAVALLLTAVALPLSARQDQVPIFKGTSDNVPVFVTVTDKSGQLVTKLQKDDFEVHDNGKVQPINVFDNSPQPIRLTILVDVSGSMERNLPLVRDAAVQLITRLSDKDEARVGSFGKEVILPEQFTRNTSELLASLPKEIPPDSPTPLWSTIDKAIGDQAGQDGRRVILVISDSKDSPGPSFKSKLLFMPDVLDHAEREDVMIYGVGVRSSFGAGSMGGMGGGGLAAAMANDLPDPQLGDLAEKSGGGYVELLPRDNLGSVFAKVLDELHQQYLLGFAPPASDGKDHKIEVKMKKPDLTARSRKSYRAPK
jgi:Ca-activated chloride channel family protein